MSYRDTWVTCEKCGKKFIFTVEEQRQQEGAGVEVTVPSVCPRCLKVTDFEPGPQEGVVKWYGLEKGYGFIVQRSGGEIFFHRSGIVDGRPESFVEGVRVTYIVEQSTRGPAAVEVALLEED